MEATATQLACIFLNEVDYFSLREVLISGAWDIEEFLVDKAYESIFTDDSYFNLIPDHMVSQNISHILSCDEKHNEEDSHRNALFSVKDKWNESADDKRSWSFQTGVDEVQKDKVHKLC